MIPILINNRDRLTTTRRLYAQCRQLENGSPVIVDNASTFPPLLEWDERGNPGVIRLAENVGPRAPWRFLRKLAQDLAHDPFQFYVVTDSDLDLAGVPADVLERLREGLERYPWAVKAGLSLEISDVPETYPFRREVIKRELPHWEQRIDFLFYKAPLDTTFAMYRVDPPWNGDYGPALRAAPPYTARHCPWYVDPATRDAEEEYYLRHLDPSGIFWSALANEPFREKV